MLDLVCGGNAANFEDKRARNRVLTRATNELLLPVSLLQSGRGALFSEGREKAGPRYARQRSIQVLKEGPVQHTSRKKKEKELPDHRSNEGCGPREVSSAKFWG